EARIDVTATNHVDAASSVMATKQPRGWTAPDATPSIQWIKRIATNARTRHAVESNTDCMRSRAPSGVASRLTQVCFSRSRAKTSAAVLDAAQARMNARAVDVKRRYTLNAVRAASGGSALPAGRNIRRKRLNSGRPPSLNPEP